MRADGHNARAWYRLRLQQMVAMASKVSKNGFTLAF